MFSTLLGIIHFIQRPKSQSNTFLGIFIIFFGFSVLHILLVNTLFQTKYNPLILLPLNLIFLPFYFLVRYFNVLLSFQVYHKRFVDSVLFIGFIEIITNLLPTGAWLYTNQFDNQLVTFVFTIKRFFVIFLIPLGTYALWEVRNKLIRFDHKINDDKVKLKWVKEILFLLSLLIIVIIVPEMARFLNVKNITLFLVQAGIGSAVVMYIGFRNLKIQVNTAIETPIETNNLNLETNLNFKNIQRLFENEKLYLNSELRITDIAKIISLTPNYVSKIVNENAHMNFNDFVNQYRINELIGKFKNNEHQKKSIIALAEESGFKSKSTFQTVFKKYMGKTPSQYINEIEFSDL
jgi:AraC-like DNA-binding protein